MSVLRTIFSMITLPVAMLKWFHSTTIAPKNSNKPVPPIRYDGDPTDIYLA